MLVRCPPTWRLATVAKEVGQLIGFVQRVYTVYVRIEAGARIEAGGQKDKSLIEARSRIVAGSRTGVSRESIVNRDRYASRSTRLRAKLVGNLS